MYALTGAGTAVYMHVTKRGRAGPEDYRVQLAGLAGLLQAAQCAGTVLDCCICKLPRMPPELLFPANVPAFLRARMLSCSPARGHSENYFWDSTICVGKTPQFANAGLEWHIHVIIKHENHTHLTQVHRTCNRSCSD